MSDGLRGSLVKARKLYETEATVRGTMMTVKSTTYALLLVTMTLTAARGQDSVRPRFEAEFPAATQKLREFYTNLRMSGTETDKDDIHQWEFCGNAELMRSVVTRKDGSVAVIVADPKLSFYLDKAPGSSHFAVSGMGPATPHDYADLVLTIWRKSLPSSAPFTILTESIADFVSEKSFKWKEAHEVDAPGGKVFRVGWENVRRGAPKLLGTFDFAADGSWALRGFEMHFPETKNTKTGQLLDTARHCVVEYQGQEAGVPLVHKLRLWNSGPSGNGSETIIEVTELKPGAVARQEFTLAAFGVSTSPAAAPIPVAYYLLGLSALAALFVLGLRYASRRQFGTVARA